MFYVFLILFVIAGYLFGSVNFASIFTKRVSGKEIRKMGSLNPGAANVVTSLGKGWGVLVAVFDGLKSFLPILVARLFIFTQDHYADFLAIFAIGIFAICGHCRPVWHKFKGGKGVGTMLGVFLFFVPIEFLMSMIIGGLIVAFFMKNVEFKWGRWTPIMFTAITPFLTLALNPVARVPLFSHISIGGHSWYILVGVFATSFFMLCINLSPMRTGLRNMSRQK